MFKTIALVSICSMISFAAGFTGRTVHSSPFQLDVPLDSAIKTTLDPANVWSWHHEFTNIGGGTPVSADVLVDFDGNGVMDTEHAWVRVMITDLEIVSRSLVAGFVWVIDGQGKRLAAGIGWVSQTGSPVQHVALTTPIVLPVGSPLSVEVQHLGGSATFEVNMMGRVVNL